MNLIAAIKSSFDLFRVGNELRHAAAWKKVQIAANLLAGGIYSGMALAGALGYHIPSVDDATIQSFSLGVAGIVNAIITVITSAKVGLPNDLPPIELQAQSDPAAITASSPTDASDASRDPMRGSGSVCDALPPISRSRSSSSPSDGSQTAGWNG